MGERLKSNLNLQNEASPVNSDCEIIEPQPELIIVNENSNSSQDVMIIDEVPPTPKAKVPKKRGRPRRNALPVAAPAAASAVSVAASHVVAPLGVSNFQDLDPLSFEQPPMQQLIQQQIVLQQQQQQQMMMLQQQQRQKQQQMPQLQAPEQVMLPGTVEASERPRRTCRSQKSYAPPKRGRGRGDLDFFLDSDFSDVCFIVCCFLISPFKVLIRPFDNQNKILSSQAAESERTRQSTYP